MNIQKMMKQAQQMQAKMQQAQEELAEKTVEVTAGGGKITVTANGAGDILAIKIIKDVVDPNDVEMLEDLILSGVQKAIETAHESGEAGASLPTRQPEGQAARQRPDQPASQTDRQTDRQTTSQPHRTARLPITQFNHPEAFALIRFSVSRLSIL